MKTPLRIATAQFENKSGDKAYNLSVIRSLTKKAKAAGADVISFHELCIPAYTFLQDLSQEEITRLAEEIPRGASVQQLIAIAREHDMIILAGLLEKEGDHFYNTYVCIGKEGVKARHRKLHPFISKHLSAGDAYTFFEINGWKCSILICYDNNIIENVRAVALSGTEVLFSPHVTMCTPSPMPGRGFVDASLWENRHTDPVPLRQEFHGPKGRQWLLRWLPARAYDNGIYIVFSNPVGMDGDQLKNGNSLIVDPYGEIITEINSFEDEITVGTITEDKLTLAGGYRYRNARRPELYKDIIGAPHVAATKPVWMETDQ